MLAFDVGGTWIRSAIVTEHGRVVDLKRRAAITVHDVDPLTAKDARAALVDYLIAESSERALLEERGIATISLGAAYDARRDLALASAPLWGSDTEPFDLLDQLRSRAPGIEWYVTNDVTAMALRASTLPQLESRTFVLITLSSGIAARLVCQPLGQIPVDRHSGLQGEIGHLPVYSSIRGLPLQARCDCGANNHLASYVSGRGLSLCLDSPLIAGIALEADRSWTMRSSDDRVREFKRALIAGENWASEVLSSLAAPLADILAIWITVDPRIDAFVFTGGLFDALKSELIEFLTARSVSHAPYLFGQRDPNWLARRLVACPPDDLGGLLGAAVFARRQKAGEKVYQ